MGGSANRSCAQPMISWILVPTPLSLSLSLSLQSYTRSSPLLPFTFSITTGCVPIVCHSGRRAEGRISSARGALPHSRPHVSSSSLLPLSLCCSPLSLALWPEGARLDDCQSALFSRTTVRHTCTHGGPQAVWRTNKLREPRARKRRGRDGGTERVAVR